MPAGSVAIELIRAHGLKDVELFGKPDPYVIISLGSQRLESHVIHDGGENPVWNQNFLIEIPDGPQELQLVIRDREHHKEHDKTMGTVSIHLSELFDLKSLPPFNYKVHRPNGKYQGELEVGLKFIPKVYHGALEVHLLEAHGLQNTDTFGKSDPYAILYYQKESQKSVVINGTTDPVWNQKFVFQADSTKAELFIKLFDKDDWKADDPLGSVMVPLITVFNERQMPATRYKILDDKGQPQGEVSLALKFTPKG